MKRASGCCERSNSAVCECRKEGMEVGQTKRDCRAEHLLESFVFFMPG